MFISFGDRVSRIPALLYLEGMQEKSYLTPAGKLQFFEQIVEFWK